MRVTVDYRLYVIEAVDRVAEPLRAEILEDLLRLALDGTGDRGIMKHRDAALGAQGAQLVLELARFVQRLVDEGLGDRLAERGELAAPVAAHEAFDAGEADAFDLHRLLVQYPHPGVVEDRRDLVRLAAFIIVIAEHADDRDRAGADVLGQDLGLAGL